jgi:hypothetical protein
MSEEFTFGIDASWAALRTLVSNVVAERGPQLTGIERMRELWLENKAELLKLLGPDGRLVLDVSDTACLTVQDMDNAYRDMMNYTQRVEFPSTWMRDFAHDVVRELVDQTDRSTFVRELASNRLIQERHYRVTDDAVKKFPVGTKLGRYARAFTVLSMQCRLPEKASDANTAKIANAVCEALSIGTSSLRVTDGQLILTVNPLEMAMASMHTSGWSSCHNIVDGCYATGSLSYLLDSCSALAYYTNRSLPCGRVDGVILPVKQWRQMVYFDLEAASALMSRQYPGTNVGAAMAARKAAALVLSSYHGHPVKWYVKHLHGYDHNDDDPDTGNYCYSGHTGWYYKDQVEARVRLNPIGKAPTVSPGVTYLPCVICGEDRGHGKHHRLVCYNCDNLVACADCETDIDLSDGYELPNGEIICVDCYENNYFTCDNCGYIYHSDHHLVAYNSYGSRIDLCNSCADTEDYVLCCSCDDVIHVDYAKYDYRGHSYCRYCAEDLLTECESCGELLRDDDDIVSTEDDVYYCPQCAEKHTDLCAECGCRFCSDDLYEYVVPGTDECVLVCDSCLRDLAAEDALNTADENKEDEHVG